MPKAWSQNCDQFIRLANGNLISSANGVAWMLDFGKIGFDSNNDIYVTGKDSYFLSKYDSLGSLLWNKSKANSIAADLVVTSNNIFVTSKEFLLSKYDINGNEIFPSVQVANASPAHIVSDQLSNVYICGQISSGTTVTFGANNFSPPPGSAYSYFLVKYNSLGQLQWSKHIVTNTTYFQPISMAIHNNSLYVHITGNNLVQAGTVSVTSNPTETRVVYKTSTNGNDSWLKLMPAGVPGNMSNDIEINDQGQIVFSGSGGLLLCDTALTTANYQTYNFPMAWPLDQSLSIHNDDFAILSTNNALGFYGATHVIITGKMSNPSAATPIYINIPTQDPTHRYLVELSPSGSLYGFFHTNGGNSDSAFVDMSSIATNTSNNIVIAKFNPAFRLLPTSYMDEIIECGNQVILGGSNGNTTPYQVPILPTFSWTPTNGLSNATAQNPICNTTTSQNYTVNINGSCVNTVNVTVDNPSSFSYQTNGMVATFSVTNSDCSSFLWDFGNGNTSSINPNPTVTYATAGTYGVCLQCNGQPSSCVQCINITVPSNTIGTTGIENIQKESGITIYPNPSIEIITIETDNINLNSNYVILNSIGQQVLSGQLTSKKHTIDISGLSAGAYVLQIGDVEKRSFKLTKN
jgi:PKD repeat protein